MNNYIFIFCCHYTQLINFKLHSNIMIIYQILFLIMYNISKLILDIIIYDNSFLMLYATNINSTTRCSNYNTIIVQDKYRFGPFQ